MFGDNLKKKAIQVAKKASGFFGSDGLPEIYHEEVLQQVDDGAFCSGSKPNFWEWDGADWYKVFPYQIGVVVKEKGGLFLGSGSDNPKYVYTLPIPPQAMVVKMQPASRATPTLGGVVEETSENTFWYIQLSGTTGTGVSRLSDDALKREKQAQEFRKRLETTGLLSGAASSAMSVASKVGGVIDALYDSGASAVDAFKNGDVVGGAGAVVGGITGSIQTALLPPMPYAGSQVSRETNGFTEIQELHRFLYIYSKLKSLRPNQFSLVFTDMKHNQRWSVVLQDFSIQRNAQNPMLYRYVIQFKGWNIRSVDASKREDFNRFGPNGDLKYVNLLELPQMTKGFNKVLDKLKKGTKY